MRMISYHQLRHLKLVLYNMNKENIADIYEHSIADSELQGLRFEPELR